MLLPVHQARDVKIFGKIIHRACFPLSMVLLLDAFNALNNV